jgi:hypothetical protein
MAKAFFNNSSASILRDRIAVYKHFFHWPALIESLERDLAKLEGRKDCSQEEPRKKIPSKNKNER